MNFSSIMSQVMGWLQNARSYVLSLSRKQKYAAVALVVIAVFALFYLLRGDTTTTATVEAKARKVTMARVDDLANQNASLPLVGVVISTSEAEIRAESSGRLTRVYKKLGDRVYAGELIAQFENSAERAAVQQAEGAYDAAKAARDIASINNSKADINSGTANTTIEDSKSAALNVINAAYTTMDDVVRSKTDDAFSNPRTAFPTVNIYSSNSQIVTELQNIRPQIEEMLKTREAKNRTISSSSDLVVELAAVQKEVQMVQTYLNDLSTLYASAISSNSVPQSMIEAQKAVVGGARSSIGGSLSGIVAAKSSLANAIAAKDVAASTPSNNTANTASADASVKSALGSYNAALSRLSKTTIKSPIAGTLNSLTVQTGDYVNQSASVAVVSNNGSLEILAYISEDDARRISVGTSVTVGSDGKGIITRIASGLDPVTKKIEVRIAIQSGGADYINGQSVRLQVSTTPQTKKVSAQKNKTIQIPLSAIKITPQGSFVFTMGASSTVKAVEVETGAILGEQIEVKTGLTQDMAIAQDARGLKDGMTVDAQ